MFSIELDQRELRLWMAAAGRQLPYATMVALNRTARRVKVEMREEMTRVFDRPTPYTLNSLMTHMATKRSPSAEVFIKDEQYGGTPPAKYLGNQIYGGTRHAKSHELALRRAGILKGNMYAVPAKDVALDKYGNIPSGKIMQMMSALGAAERSAGYQMNITRASLARHPKRARYFTIGSPPIGVFTRQGGVMKPFIMFVRSPHYTQRLDFFGVGKRVVEEHLVNEMRTSVEQALRTAR
jgi:hypothetical protein